MAAWGTRTRFTRPKTAPKTRAPAKPAPKPAAAAPKPRTVAAGMDPRGVGTLYDPVQQFSAPSFEGQDALDQALNAEMQRLGAAELGAGRAELATGEQRVREDLATRLANLQREREQAGRAWQQQQEDIRRQQEEARRQQPIAVERTRTGMSARGVEFGGIKEEAAAETARPFEEAVAAGERAIARGGEAARAGEQEAEAARQGYEREAARGLEDVARQRAEFDRKVREGQIQTQAQRAQSQRGEASSWVRSRYNQLLAEGASEEQARSRSVVDARQSYPRVGDTWLVGALGKPAKPVTHPSIKTFGVEISPARGSKITGKKAEQLRARTVTDPKTGAKRNPYKAHFGNIIEFQRVSGGRGTTEQFMRWLMDNLQAARPFDKPAMLRSRLAKEAHVISLALQDAGLAD